MPTPDPASPQPPVGVGPRETNTSTPGATGYKRASRKGAPKRFPCTYGNCSKVYSRQEHLQRHMLNHQPKDIFKCDVPNCDQMFVRLDLLERHKKRHSSTYVPRNRGSSFNVSAKDQSNQAPGMLSPEASTPGPNQASAPRNASVLLTTESSNQSTMSGLMSTPQPSPLDRNASWSAPMGNATAIPNQTGLFGQENVPMYDSSSFEYNGMQNAADGSEMARENFAMWLFDPQLGPQDFNMANLNFLEGGLETPFNNNIRYDHESLTTASHVDMTPPQQSDLPDDLIPEYRRQEIIHWLRMFRTKQTRKDPAIDNLLRLVGEDMPNLSHDLLQEFLRQFWDIVSPRIPIIHKPTFSSSRCSVFLFMAMIALGSVHMQCQSASNSVNEYGALSDLIIQNVRWEILTADAASPPVDLWVAQALLLVEFYEKMYSSRKFHERAHIYHTTTLTLLRRGNPLIGRSGSESPPEDQQGTGQPQRPGTSDNNSSWTRWAQRESMHRVVYVAFMMDIVHAAMFSHTADMLPHEIRLPLPCDEALWTATTADAVRQQESMLRMYGVKPVSFLDGLKRALHGEEVKTHSFGRMIIMCGLLSVGWHLRHRETHLKWLEMKTSSSETREKWYKILLKAFDDWKTSFDSAVRDTDADMGATAQSGSSGLIQNAAVLYHLAHMSLYVDIVECQVYAKATHLVGRKVSTRDYANAVSRMRTWTSQPSTRHAIQHAFKLLEKVLLDTRYHAQNQNPNGHHPTRAGQPFGIGYSFRADTDAHRPWIVYYATLSIWSFVRDFSQSSNAARVLTAPAQLNQQTTPGGIMQYLTEAAALSEIGVDNIAKLRDGLPELLKVVSALASESHSEILREAAKRLDVAKQMLLSGAE